MCRIWPCRGAGCRWKCGERPKRTWGQMNVFWGHFNSRGETLGCVGLVLLVLTKKLLVGDGSTFFRIQNQARCSKRYQHVSQYPPSWQQMSPNIKQRRFLLGEIIHCIKHNGESMVWVRSMDVPPDGVTAVTLHESPWQDPWVSRVPRSCHPGNTVTARMNLASKRHLMRGLGFFLSAIEGIDT
ncbi:hypothetical protein AV530_011423 [Patagioenas fasciata monilis]|uniref:Uncharacterized protein n=1 Tax=Patagioenas fasciata monilis TaxID=372326 RepID=A0A1V4KPC2_PATFA|nr:hypothetical protein AV530_011423 [Patagioenas fasciata monilis]